MYCRIACASFMNDTRTHHSEECDEIYRMKRWNDMKKMTEDDSVLLHEALKKKKMTRSDQFKDSTDRIIDQNTNTFEQTHDEQTTDPDMSIWDGVVRHRILDKSKLQCIRHDLYLIFIQSRRYVIDMRSTKKAHRSVTRRHALSDDHVQTFRRQDIGAASQSWLLSFVFLYDQ